MTYTYDVILKYCVSVKKIYFEATRSRVTTEKRMTYIPMTVSKCNKRCEDREKRKETDHDDMI